MNQNSPPEMLSKAGLESKERFLILQKTDQILSGQAKTPQQPQVQKIIQP